ncbi:hypothetical protein SAY86_019977 [Trapa natans]|uniref:peroxidase n=1 Tax=Trapa natans TaxID=22666 RepID=A0AAN7R7A6_TRANT|nr:hypothetical protein SAY86_019977 [Trapa natans]
MAPSTSITIVFLTFLATFSAVAAQLSSNFYSSSCPSALSIIRGAVSNAVSKEARMGASLLRLHFHDCFVNGCDASILLDDTTNFKGEKTAAPNDNSVRGYDVVDTIKSQLESRCPGVVSCADILAVAARDSVVALGGTTWTVQLGRRDSTTASFDDATNDLPSPLLDLSDLITAFSNKGFTAKELVALSGSHTIGQARCSVFRSRIYNDTDIDSSYASSLQKNCPSAGGDSNLSPLDSVTANNFDNEFFKNLLNKKGLLHSDQQLFSGGSTNSLVTTYSQNSANFFTDFANAMVKMGNLSPLTGSSGEIRKNCRKVNGIIDRLHIKQAKTIYPSSPKMAASSSITVFFYTLLATVAAVAAQLSSDFYSSSCPNALSIIQSAVNSAVSNEARMGASLLRLHFHDCFVNGCDASILLDDTTGFTGEKTAGGNANSVRGYDVIDTIKSQLESSCPGVVSCADIVAVAARDSVVALGGTSWTVQLGRRDSTTASLDDANRDLPSPDSSLDQLTTAFSNKGFNANELVALSGSHTIGKARCTTFRSRIYNDTNINSTYAASLQQNCPTAGGDNNLAPLDSVTENSFDNEYFKNLVNQEGLLHSDQVLYNGGSTDSQVTTYSQDSSTFLSDFADAMVKMGNLSPLTGSSGEIRTDCRKVNGS